MYWFGPDVAFVYVEEEMTELERYVERYADNAAFGVAACRVPHSSSSPITIPNMILLFIFIQRPTKILIINLDERY